MKITVQIWEENQGTNFDIEVPSKKVASDIISKFIEEDVSLVRIEKQHQNDTGKLYISPKDCGMSNPLIGRRSRKGC